MATETIERGRVRIDWDSGIESHALEFQGEIDERCQFAELATRLGPQVALDLGGITFVNSMGVREWIRFLRKLREIGARVTLRDCSEAIVYQMNMIPETRVGAQVESFQAPYDCPSCGHEASMRIVVAEHREALRRGAPPCFDCAECGEEMEFSELTERYLLFLEPDLRGSDFV